MSDIRVKEYRNAKEFEKDGEKMLRDGWYLEGQTSGRGGASVGGTAAKLVLTGGLGAITGLSRKKDRITVTWLRDGANEAKPSFMEKVKTENARVAAHKQEAKAAAASEGATAPQVPHTPKAPPQYSADGLYWWTGTEWRPAEKKS